MRYLSPSEALFLHSNMPAVCLLELDGGVVDADVLSEAFAALAAENPILRSKITRDDQGALLQAEPAPRPLAVSSDVANPGESEANNPLEPDRALARLTLYRQGMRSTIAMAVHHCVADGLLLNVLAERLLTYYARLVTGDALHPVPCDSFHEPLDNLVPTDLPPLPLPTFDTVTTLQEPASDSTAHGTGVLSVQFDEADTAAILASGKQDGLSPFGLLCGTAAASICSEQADPDAAHTMTVWSLIGLRTRLAQPVAPDANIFCSGMAILPLRSEGQPDPVDLGRQAMAELNSALEQQIPQRVVPMIGKMGPMVFPTISMVVSNVGRMPAPPLPGGLRLLAHRGIVPPDQNATSVSLIMITTGGRLGLDVVYSRAALSDSRIRDWTKRLRFSLEARVH